MNVPVKQDGISYKNVAIAQHGGGGMLMPTNFGEVVAFSEIMARSQHAIPRHLRDVPGACLAVTMQALRWELDPFLVASKSYNVKDIIAYEAQLIAAVVHTRAPIKSRPNYTYSGEGQDRRCTVSAMFDDGTERSYESPRIGDITTKNSPLWKSDPDQQLGYFSIRSFARRYCPEVILGVYTPEEAEQFRGPDNARDVTPRPSLSERLAANQSQGDGFSQQHVVSEIDGQQNAGTSPVEAAQVDHAGERPAPNSNSSLAQPPAETDTPATSEHPPAPVAGTNSAEIAEQSTRDNLDGPVGQSSSSEILDSGTSSLPDGWDKDYVAALKRSQKPDSLPKYANQFWEQDGYTKPDKDSDDGRLAAAIYAAFKSNFGNKDAIEAELREVLA